MLLRERRIDAGIIRKLLGWRHSGFSLHNDVRIGAQDAEGRRAVSEYILRSPFSQGKLRYHAKSGTTIYRSKMHPVLKRNFVIGDGHDFMQFIFSETGFLPPSPDALRGGPPG